jgi:hypothetical protein
MDHIPPLGPAERIILVELSKRQTVTMEHIIHVLYGHRIDGGPDDPANNFRVTLTRLRKKLSPLGIRIENVGRGCHAPSFYAIRGVERETIRRALAAFYGPEILRKAA